MLARSVDFQNVVLETEQRNSCKTFYNFQVHHTDDPELKQTISPDLSLAELAVNFTPTVIDDLRCEFRF